ncbi:fructose-specific PTS transporter subunit EIIC [Nitrospirillum sp. BR 11163]|uniref:fructose-specific PTS transporter subunit EIIC n=1 Tax=Nitrospirillum sp. BR 11163 TaxID=3104323 RepID=UPI002AFE7DB2|nr:fructose-specific PTS transporter subunit EIIC [Nitrospirillum sp. BR 11163]MEA1674678.1 fructose-specific PTS transporter subunit EIIC [Nitrospirillum sp. BR 11163]
MSALLAVIGAGEMTIHALLAAEALRRAATGGGHTIAVEVRTGQGVLGALEPAQIQDAHAVLLVGSGILDADRFGALPHHSASIEAVLADPAAALDALVLAEPESAKPPRVKRDQAAALSKAEGPRHIVAITSCPTGIAHTFMAAEGLQQGAKTLGHIIRVETQGSVGARDGLTDDEIAAADIVIIAADRQVDLGRFAGKRVFQSATKPAISDGAGLIQRALAEATPLAEAEDGAPDAGRVAGASPQAAAGAKAGRGVRTGPYKHLMTGVSFMLPFVVAGGLLIALAFALGGIYAYDDAHKGTLAYALFQVGAKGAFVLIVPVLAGYIAHSVADRPGIAPGMIGGMVAANLQAGFLGGILAGFIAGYGTAFLNRHIRLPRTLEGLKPVLILPLLGTLLTGLLMIYVVGGPTAGALAALTTWLKGMQGSSAILLGVLIGGMMAFDMGGPINKAAYAFSTGLIASQVYTPMAAAMVAGMTPPLGLALAAHVFANRFTAEERETRGAAAVLGLAFVTEGAIPFAARDPLRVIPALVAGSAVAGAISMAIGAELRVPHGGVFVLPIPNAVSHVGGYVAALAIGAGVTAVALRVLKRPV